VEATTGPYNANSVNQRLDEFLATHTVLDNAGVPMGDLVERVRSLAALCRELEDAAEAQRKRTDRERLLEALDGDPSELLLLLHDAALDRGPEGEGEARGWGWLAAHHRWPGRNTHRGWFWWKGLAKLPAYCHYLPERLLDAMSGHERAEVWYPTARAALEAVAGVIARGEWEGP
jgi:hypothetical protein